MLDWASTLAKDCCNEVVLRHPKASLAIDVLIRIERWLLGHMMGRLWVRLLSD